MIINNFFTVLFTKIKFISSVENKSNAAAVPDGIARALGIWPLIYKQQNMVVSTLPVRLALNKLAAAAEGPAKAELLTTLGINDTKALAKFFPRLNNMLRGLLFSDLIMLNKIYINQSSAISPSFLSDSFENFGVQVEKTRFVILSGVVSFVNQWVDSATYKRIPNLLSLEDINPYHNMFLVNALHIKPTWEKKFDIRLSRMKPFHLHNMTDTIEMRMMTAIEEPFFYYKDNYHKFQVLMLHLDCNGCKITFYLPYDVSGLPNLVKLLAKNPSVMKKAEKQMNTEILNVRLPVMKIKTKMIWNPYLSGLGIKKIFNFGSSGLDSITQGIHKNYYLGKVIQKVFIEIDEFGAYRNTPNKHIRLPEKKGKNFIQQFIADHPFFFKIEIDDEDSGISHELFTGVFYGVD